MTKRQFLAIMYLLTGVIPLIAQTFTEQKKSYPVSADGNKYVVSGFTPFSDMQDENIYANALLWIVKNVCPQLREGIAEVNVPAKNFSCDLILASQADSNQKNTYYCKALFQVKDGRLVYYLSNIRIESSAVIMKKITPMEKLQPDKKASHKEIMDDFIDTILEIHESIMGNKECSFSLQTVDKARKKTPVELTLRIYDDGSHSVDRTKVFIYDMALLFNQYTRDRHPLFLVHDNIFDVDQDTLVQCLNYIYKQEEQYQDFQYILTLNRDKIENEEQRKLIQMDIDEHQVAVFTKEKKFLGRNYQEK